MRKPSALEMESADSSIDLALLRRQHEELRGVLEDKGVPVFMLGSDEKSPFSSRIGRYYLWLPGGAVLAPHPDGCSVRAHRQLEALFKEKRIDLRLHDVQDWKPGCRIDPRDAIIAGDLLVLLYRDGGTNEQGSGILNELVTRHGPRTGRRREVSQLRMRGIDGSARGLRLPLSRFMCSVDGDTLCVDSSNKAAVDAAVGTGLTMADNLAVRWAPPWTQEAFLLETRSGGEGRPVVLFPSGFPEAEGFLRMTFDNIDLVIVDWTEFLKLGVSLRDAVGHIRPIMTSQGEYSGAFARGEKGAESFGGIGAEAAGYTRMFGKEGYDPKEQGWDPLRQPMTPHEAFVHFGSMPPPGEAMKRDIAAFERTRERAAAMGAKMQGLHGTMAAAPHQYRAGFKPEPQWQPGQKLTHHEHSKASSDLKSRVADVRQRKKKVPWSTASPL